MGTTLITRPAAVPLPNPLESDLSRLDADAKGTKKPATKKPKPKHIKRKHKAVE
jgi:hypothetical protein